MKLQARLMSALYLAPAITIFPLENIRSVTLGFLTRQTKAGKISGSQWQSLYFLCAASSYSSLMLNPTSVYATMFTILKLSSLMIYCAYSFCTSQSFCWRSITLMIVFSIILAASQLYSIDLAPVITILPLEKISPVAFGSLMRIMQAENLLGLYSTLRSQMWSIRKSSLNCFRAVGISDAVATIFIKVGGKSCPICKHCTFCSGFAPYVSLGST